MCRFFEKLLIFLIVAVFSNGNITAEEYASMPKIFHLDDYDSCLMNKANHHYCLISYELAPLDSKSPSKIWQLIKFISSTRKNYRHDWLRHGLCISNLFSNKYQHLQKNETEIKKLLQEMYDKKYEDLGLHGTITEMQCETFDLEYKVSFFEHFVKRCLVAYIVFIIAVSVYDITFVKDGIHRTYTYNKLILAFSLPRNWKKLTTIADTPETLRLRSFHGVRSLSLMIVILTHCAFVAFSGFVENPKFIEMEIAKSSQYFFINGVVLVQLSFMMSSWFLTYHTFERWYEEERISFFYVLKVIIYRYIRLTPVLFVVLLFDVSWWPHISRGPIWRPSVVKEYYNCRKNWWKNLLYINNFGDISDMCMQHTWYLGNDTFYFIIGLLFMWSIWKYKKYFLQIVITVTILFQAGVFIHLYVNKYDISTPLFPEYFYMGELLRAEQLVIGRSWYVNIPGLFAGLIWGYIYFKYKNVDIPKTKVYLIFYNVSFYSAMAIIIYSPGYLFLEKNIDRHSPLMAGYCVLSKFFAPFFVAYMLFLMSHNISVGLSGILESKLMVMFSRTSYSLYVVHATFNYIRIGKTRYPTFNSYYQILSDTSADFTFSLVFAWILTLLIESPMIEIVKLLFPIREYNEKVSLKNINNNIDQNGHEEKLKNKDN